MKREEMILQLNTKHEAFIHDIELLSDNLLLHQKDQKWSAAQQLNHIIRSVQPLVQVLVLPSFLLKLFFGKANRPSLSYEQLLLKYKSKLEKGGRASGRFVPNQELKLNKEKEILKLSKLIAKLCRQITKVSESDLDIIILPHPLLGKLTLREMICFTIFHVELHTIAIKKNLE